MNCPVCGDTAEDITSPTFDGKSIRCTTCGDYDISGSIYDPGTLLKLEPDERKRALDKAKRSARPGQRPMITSYNL